MSIAERRVYCIDSSSLIYCQQSFGNQPSRVTFFAAVWTLLDRLADDGRLLAPHLVFIEVTRSDDHIARWAKAHRGVFRPKGEHASRVTEILREPSQRLVSATAPRGAEEADPWVIALAEAISAEPPQLWERHVGVVVAEESKPGGIGNICVRRGIEQVDLVGMLSAEGVGVAQAAET